uniref:PEP-CTERM protein-sorting domain-containing protein n=1 Tax=Solibacter usitatus (strain Ellin6076) TaxID=234267 RepID=Q02CN9_SOLUE
MTRIFLWAAMLLTAGVPSQASIIFSNLIEPGDQYGPDGVGIGHTPAFSTPGDYLSYGVRFVPSLTAQLTMIQAPFAVVSGPNQVQAFLMGDAGGVPGNVIESFALMNLPPPGQLLTINSLLDPLVLAGQPYWFVATGGGVTFALWTLNLFQGDPNDGGATQFNLGGVPQPWSTGSGTRTGALQVSGDVAPEPATVAIFACAALVFFIRKKR